MPFHFANRISRIVHWGKKAINNKRLTINAKGFTLIEILVVMSIMAVLAGGLLYSTNNARDKGKDARRKDDLKALSTAAVAYYTDHNKYPPTDPNDPLDYVSDSSDPAGWIPELATYLNKFPKDPLQTGLLAPLAAVFENGKKIASSSWSWLATNQTATQKPKGQVAGIVEVKLGNEITTPGSNGDTNYFNGSKFTTGPNGGQATKMSINAASIAASPNYQLVIYSDNSGVPGTLIAKTAGTETLVVGWNEASLLTPLPTLDANTSYWLMVSTSGDSNVTKSTATTNSYYFSNPNSFGTPPSTKPAAGAQGPENLSEYSIYATYTYSDTGGTYSAKVNAGPDDGKVIVETTLMENFVLDTPQGFTYNCPNQTRNNFLLFRNVNIPPNSNIEPGASIKFSPRTDRPDDRTSNSWDPTKIRSILRSELNPNPQPISSWADYVTRHNTASNLSSPVTWNNIPIWYPNPTISDLTTPNITSIIQAAINQPGWASGNNIMIYWDDNGSDSTVCSGQVGASRVGVSFEGQQPPNNLGDAPRLTITWTASAPPTTCTDPLANNNGDPLPCTYDPIPATTGACNDKPTNVYCLRTSANQKAFVLWAMLENTNDPELYTNISAPCNLNDPDFGTSTSPFYGLNTFTGSPGFNYCIKSPQ